MRPSQYDTPKDYDDKIDSCIYSNQCHSLRTDRTNSFQESLRKSLSSCKTKEVTNRNKINCNPCTYKNPWTTTQQSNSKLAACTVPLVN